MMIGTCTMGDLGSSYDCDYIFSSFLKRFDFKKVPCNCIGLKVYSISCTGVPRSSTLKLVFAGFILVVLMTFFFFLGGDCSNYFSIVFCIPATFSFDEAVC